MILHILMLFVVLSCFFTALAFQRGLATNYVMACVLWFATAGASIDITVPYQYIIGDTVYEGVQRFAGAEPLIAWVFALLGFIMFFYALDQSFKGKL